MLERGNRKERKKEEKRERMRESESNLRRDFRGEVFVTKSAS